MKSETIEYYENKLSRKAKLLEKLQRKENDLAQELSVKETIDLRVLQSEVRLLKEVIEDLQSL